MPFYKLGQEFLVNTQILGNQLNPQILSLSNGNFLVDWYDTPPYTGGPVAPFFLRTQLYADDGTPTGGEITTTMMPSAVLSDGRLIGITEAPFYTSVSAQFFDGSGQPLGSSFVINSNNFNGYAQLVSPSVAMLPSGGFVAAWAALMGPYGPSYIFSQIFDAAGHAVGQQSFVANGGINPSVQTVSMTNGRYAVLWEQDNYALHTQIFNSDGTAATSDILIDTSSSYYPPTEAKIVGLSNGGFALIWEENRSSGGYVSLGPLHAQAFDALGHPTSADVIVDARGPAQVASTDIAALPSGDFVVVWASFDQGATSTLDTEISARVFAPSGAEVGSEQIVNTTIAGTQIQPSVAALDNGGFVVSWADGSQTAPDTSGFAIHAQIFAYGVGGTYAGTAGNDTITGSAFDDVLIGLAGNDVLDGGAGSDTASYADAIRGVTADLGLSGIQATGNGKDTLISIENLIGSNYGDKLYGNAGDNTLDGGKGTDTLYGRAGNDQLRGGAGNDHLLGGGGNDILDGSTGADTLEGGAGNDSYYVDGAGDVVVENAGAGIDWVYSTIDYTLTTNVEKLTLIDGSGNISGTGNALNNAIVGNDGNNIINGSRGSDMLTGGAGADSFVLDVLNTSAYKDSIQDFASGTDHIELSSTAFVALAGYGLGALDPGELTYGGKATTAGQHLIYNTSTGALFYDIDGVSGQAQIQIALLKGHPTLLASDIVII